MNNNVRSHNFIDLTNRKIGRLTIKRYFIKKKNKLTYTVWLCKCDCGKWVKIRANNILRGTSKSCGCLSKEIARKMLLGKKGKKARNYKHGRTGTKTFNFELQIKHQYKLSIKEYYRMLKKQNNRCAICKEKHKLNIDHNHETGKVRGLLCHNCNQGIGCFKDNKNLLTEAIKYIRR